jgi:hypothetical protein
MCELPAGDPAAACTGDAAACAADYCDTAGFSAECIENLDAYLDCLEDAPPELLYCRDPGVEPEPYDNTIGVDFAVGELCPELALPRDACLMSQSSD